jgi:hypothetical protein
MISISSSDKPKFKKGLLLILCSLVIAAIVITIMIFGGRREVYMGLEFVRVLLQASGAYLVAYSFQKRFSSVLWLGIWILCNGAEIVLMGLISYLMINHPTVNMSFGGLVIVLGIDIIIVFYVLNRVFPRRIP